MKAIFKHSFNISFLALFICIFSFIIYTFSDSIVLAFTSNSPALSKNDTLDIDKCQRWTNGIRDFNVKKEDKANRIPVINYHKIVDDAYINRSHYDEEKNLHSTIVLKSEFEKQMAFLKENNFTALNLAEFLAFMKNKLIIPKNSILITFDDGFKNTYNEAYPILKKYGFTAVNFLITGYIEKNNNSFDPAISQYLSIADVLKGCDTFDYQAHTYNLHSIHANGQSILVNTPPEKLVEDFSINFKQLQKNTPSFAYPYGEYNKTVRDTLDQLGVTMAFTIKEGDARPGQELLEIPRKTVLPTHDIKDFMKLVNM